MLKVVYSQILNPAEHHPARITKIDEILGDELDFEEVKFPVKIKDIHKIKKTNSIAISVFGYENKRKHPIYITKECYEDKHVDLLSIGERERKHCVFIKDFNTFMYNHIIIFYIMEKFLLLFISFQFKGNIKTSH